MFLDEIFHERRHPLCIRHEISLRIPGLFIIERLADTDRMTLPAFISHDEEREDRRLEFSGKDAGPLRKGEDAVHKEHRDPCLIPILVGEEAQDVILLHRARCCDHFIAARPGEEDVLPRAGAVVIDDPHQRVISLLLSDR